MGGSTPDFTPEAITAIVLAVVQNFIVLVVLNLSDAQRGAINGLITAVVLGAFLVHSAVVRHGRANVVAAQGQLPGSK